MLRKLCPVFLLALAWLVAGDRSADPLRAADKDGKAAAKEGGYAHVVLFTLKKDAPEGALDAVAADAHDMLAKIPSVRHVSVGRPAEKATPMYSKKDYHLGLLVLQAGQVHRHTAPPFRPRLGLPSRPHQCATHPCNSLVALRPLSWPSA